MTTTFKDTIFKKPGFSKVSECEILHVDPVPTRIPALNLILGGDPKNGGIRPGIIQFVGDSSTFKTSYCLEIASSFVKKYEKENPVILFYSNEHGATPEYFKNFGLKDEDVAYKSFEGIEDLTHGMMNDIYPATLDDKVLIIVDSIGMASSKKEADDLLAGEDKTDMTRAKKLNSFARVMTPRLKARGIPCLLINHYYDTQEMFSKKVIAGGKKLYLASDTILFTSSKKLKDGDSVVGQTFCITAIKSRFVKQNLQVSINIHEKEGIDTCSGLLELGTHSNFLKKIEKNKCKELGLDGRKTWVGYNDKYYTSSNIPKNVLLSLLENEEFQSWCYSNYSIGGNGQNGIYDVDSTKVDFELPDDNDE